MTPRRTLQNVFSKISIQLEPGEYPFLQKSCPKCLLAFTGAACGQALQTGAAVWMRNMFGSFGLHWYRWEQLYMPTAGLTALYQ